MDRGAPYLSVDPVTGQPIATYPDGTVVPLEDAPTPEIVYEGAPNAVQGNTGGSRAPVTDPLWFASEPATGDASVSGGYRSGGYSGRRYSSGGYSDDYSSGYDDDYVPRPSFANGELHPAWGGDFRVPGGRFAEQGYEDEWRPPIEAPPSPSVPTYGGGQAWNDQGRQSGAGGSYGANSPLGQQLRAKVEGMAGKITGGSSSGYSSDSYGTDAGKVREERMHGEYARGMDPGQAAGLTLRPTAMIPRVFGGLGPDAPAYQNLAELPAAQLAMLSNKYKGTTSSLVNSLGTVYERAGAGKLPSTQQLLGNLRSSKGINQMFEGQKAGPGDMESYSVPGYAYGAEPLMLGEAATTYGGLLDAAMINMPALTQEKYSSMPGGYGSYMIDKWASKALKKPAGKGVPINRFVGKRIFR